MFHFSPRRFVPHPQPRKRSGTRATSDDIEFPGLKRFRVKKCALGGAHRIWRQKGGRRPRRRKRKQLGCRRRSPRRRCCPLHALLEPANAVVGKWSRECGRRRQAQNTQFKQLHLWPMQGFVFESLTEHETNSENCS